MTKWHECLSQIEMSIETKNQIVTIDDFNLNDFEGMRGCVRAGALVSARVKG